jgi:hypothetical protein
LIAVVDQVIFWLLVASTAAVAADIAESPPLTL